MHNTKWFLSEGYLDAVRLLLDDAADAIVTHDVAVARLYDIFDALKVLTD